MIFIIYRSIMSEIPSAQSLFSSSSSSFFFLLPAPFSSRIVQMEQSTHKVSIFFGSFNVFMRRVSCVRACLLFHIFFRSLALSISLLLLHGPVVQFKNQLYVYTLAGWMHEKEHPSESVIIIESAPMHASSTQHKKVLYTHTNIQTELWRKIAGLHYYIYYGCIHKKALILMS